MGRMPFKSKTYANVRRKNGEMVRLECTKRPFWLAANAPTQAERRMWWDKINATMAEAGQGEIVSFEIEKRFIFQEVTNKKEIDLWRGMNEGGEGWEPAFAYKVTGEESVKKLVTY